MILVCTRWQHQVLDMLKVCKDRGWDVNLSQLTAVEPTLGTKYYFRSFSHAGDTYKVVGFQFEGVLGFERVEDVECRTAIATRLRVPR